MENLYFLGEPLRGMKAFVVSLAVLFMLAPAVLAQEKTITGKVIASDTKEPMPGVNVIVKGKTIGTMTGVDGAYSIKVPSDHEILVFSFIGYANQEISVSGKTVINVTLEQQKTALDEVVVVGYGTVKKSDLTGSVGVIKSDDLTKITSLNPEQSLQGKVTGVQVTSTSGAPGAVPFIRVRGVGTFNNTAPIFVVDGVILDDISFLNTADIASMEVLKDASATAMYGSRGANGVIIITTKSGKMGETKPSFSYSGEYGIQSLAKKISLLNGKEFATIANEIQAGTYNNTDLVPNTDWQSLIFHTAPMQNHQLSVSGGTHSTQYYIGLGYFRQEGIIDKSNFQRITLKFNNKYNLSPIFRIGNNISLAPYQQQNAPNVTYSVYRAQPVLKPYYPDGSFGVVYNVGNPLADLAYSNNFNKGIRGVGDIYAEASFFNSLTFKSSFGLDAAYNKSVSFTPQYTVYNPDGTASQQQNAMSRLNKGFNDNLTWLWENTLTFDKTYGKHAINAVAGYTMQQANSEYFNIPAANIIRNGRDFWYISGLANLSTTYLSITNGVDPGQYYSMMSYLFRTNYTYDGKYLFTVTFRRDGSSKFAQQNRFGNFPSFAAGWNVSREEFMKNIPFINNLKVRASWGQIGNDKIQYWNRYAATQNLVAVFGTSPATSSAVTYGTSGNPNLKWETTTQSDLGLEIGMLDNRLTGEFDYYHRITRDILIDLTTPGYLGNGQGQKITFNAAQVLNTGFEATVTWKDHISDLNYSVSVNGSTLHNVVQKVGGSSGVDTVLFGGYLANGASSTASKVGLPIGAFYGYKTDGIFQSTNELNAYPHSSQAGVGDLRFVDVSGDQKIDGSDRTYIGSPIPKFIFGLNYEMSYKGFDFSFDIQGQSGNKILNAKDIVRPDPYNFEKHVLNRWTGPGTSNTEPKPSWGGYNYSVSDRFVLDGSFLRLRNIMIGYSLPASVINKLKMNELRLYLKATNLYTLTKYTGYTPEIGSSDVISNGIDSGIYPITAVYSFGVNLTF